MTSVRRSREAAHGTSPVGGCLLGAALLLAACEQASVAPPSPAGEPPAAAEAGEGEGQPALAVLHARGAAQLLGRAGGLAGPADPVTFGEELSLVLELRNPFPEEVELLMPADGYRLELDWTVERRFPAGGAERTRQNRVAGLRRVVRIPPGGVFREELPFLLEEGDPLSAVWDLELGLALRCAGLRVGARELPMAEFSVQPARFRAYPPGWRELAAEPLVRLIQAAALASPLADRHLLVCAELLPAEDREAAVRALAEALPQAPTPERAATIGVALDRLTGLGYGAAPQRWIEWWAQRQNGGG
jgi:hypothetical protein